MKFRTLLVVAMTLMAGVSMVIGQDVEPTDSKAIALVAVGDVDTELFERVRAFVEKNYTIPVEVLEAQEAAENLNAAADQASSLLAPSHLFVVGLVGPSSGEESHGMFFPQKKAAIVNVASLEPENDPERYGRRIERQTMKSVAMLFGMTMCPNPHCALCSYKTNEDMDRLGRGLCPPCLHRAKEAAKSQGVKLIQPTTPSFPR